jgi:cysteine desulfurase
VALVSVMWANNETGVLQPVHSIGERCRARGVRFHCDATQWVGRMPTDVANLPVDLVTASAHKFHGPKGVGVLWVRGGVRVLPQVIGGPQERDRRGGTENVAGIVGTGVAADAAVAWLADPAGRERGAAMRDDFERAVLAAVPDAVVNGGSALRLWNTSNIGFPGLEAEALLLLLSERGVAASAGAACSSGSLDPSPVLLAMGVPPRIAHGSVRFSIARTTTEEELRIAAEEVAACVARLRRSA